MPMGHRGPAALAAWRPPASTSHLGRCSRLIDEDQALRGQLRLGIEPGPATSQDVSPLLLAGVRGFF
ncbi:MAG: hypothetical protein QOE02_2999 [Rhodospirillaceae bacterium]|nr:hypothetical protein [Rhodospirillaceae bacterium]